MKHQWSIWSKSIRNMVLRIVVVLSILLVIYARVAVRGQKEEPASYSSVAKTEDIQELYLSGEGCLPDREGCEIKEKGYDQNAQGILDNSVIPVPEGLRKTYGIPFANDSMSSTSYGLPLQDEITQRKQMITPRSIFCSAVVDNQIYAVGGLDGWHYLSSVERYDPLTDTWDYIKPMSIVRARAAVAATYGKLYVMGGYNSKLEDLNSVEMYDPATDTWTIKASMSAARKNYGAAALNGKIYVVGGDRTSTSVEVYNPLTDSWSPAASLPRQFYTVQCGAVNGKLYAIGSSHGSRDILVMEYDPASNVWTSKESHKTVAADYALTVINHKIYIVGGYDDVYQGDYLKRVYEYDPAADCWTEKTSMPTARNCLSAVTINGSMYVMGGKNGTGTLNLVERFTPAAEEDSGQGQTVDVNPEAVKLHFGEEGVHPASGNFTYTDTDMSLLSPGFQINISRTYNSLDDKAGILGKGWTFGFEGRITEGSHPSIKKIRLPNGSQMTFAGYSDGLTYEAIDSHNTLTRYQDGTFLLVTSDNYRYTFNTKGYLTRMADKVGNYIQLELGNDGRVLKISDITGKYYSLDYANTDKIRIVREYDNGVATGREVEYIYQENRLSKVINPLGFAANYSYDNEGYLSEIKDHRGNCIQSIQYILEEGENQHKIRSVTDIFGNTYHYSYDNTSGKTIITDSNERKTINYYDNNLYETVSIDAEGRASKVEYHRENEINQYGDIKSITDRNGNKTLYEVDSYGNITKIINPDFSYKEFTYDNKGNKLSERDELGNYTFYQYDSAQKNVILKAQPINGTDIYYNGCEEARFAITRYSYYSDSECAALGYQAKGLLKSVTDALGNSIFYTYHRDGKLKTVSDPETGKLTSYTYNASGFVTSKTSPEGRVTEYQYDKLNQVVKILLRDTANSESSITAISYDEQGRKQQLITPNLYSETQGIDTGYRYRYDSFGKLTSSVDPEGYATSYTYDRYGNLLTEIRPDQSIYRYEYDSMNRITAKYFKESGSAPKEIRLEEYHYEILPDGRSKTVYMKSLNETESAVTTYIYDYADRLVEQQNADATYQRYYYNSNGTLARSSDVNNAVTYFYYDKLGRLEHQYIPYEKEGNGNILYSHTIFGYDKLGRRTSERVLDEKNKEYRNKQYTYDKNGRLTSVTDREGRKTAYTYDPDGNLIREDVFTDAVNKNTTEYVYDYRNKVIVKKVHAVYGDFFPYDSSDQRLRLIEESYSYDKNGNLRTIKNMATSFVTEYQYDNLDRRILTCYPMENENGDIITVTERNTYNWEGKLLTTTDAKGSITRYTYTPLGFMEKSIAEGKADGKEISYTHAFYYDIAGRKIAEVSPNHYEESKSLGEMNHTYYTYDKMNRLKLIHEKYRDSVSGQRGDYITKEYRYDNCGNIIKEFDALGYKNGYATLYGYNLMNQLVYTWYGNALIQYGYDCLGRKISETNACGAKTTIIYNDIGNITEIKEEGLGTKTYTYDLAGRMLSQTDANRNTTYYQYNSMNLLKTIRMPGDETIPVNEVTKQYDVMGRLAAEKDSMGKVQRYVYDLGSRVIAYAEETKEGLECITWRTGYDITGNKRYEFYANGKQTDRKEYSYDAFNRLSSATVTVNGENQTSCYTYDKNGNIIKTTDWVGNTYQYAYDPLDRLIEKRDPYTIIQKLSYNENNLQIQSVDALGNRTSYEYDNLNRLIATTDPEGNVTRLEYDDFGNIERRFDGNGQEMHYVYDEYNRLSFIDHQSKSLVTYTYDANRNVIGQSDGKKNKKTYQYNCRNLLVKRADPLGEGDPDRTEAYTYHANGLLKTKTDRNGKITVYTYDIHGRLTSKSIGAEKVTYTYDARGNQLTVTDSLGTITRTYDELNRVITKTVPSLGTSYYIYDIRTNLTVGVYAESIKDPKGNVTLREFDKAGRLVAVTADGKTTQYEYYANGSKSCVRYPDGSEAEYTYTENGLPQTIINRNAGGQAIESYQYLYDAANNLIKITDHKGITEYTYDSMNRIAAITEPSARKTSYSYDYAGNRETETVIQNNQCTETRYLYGEQNRLQCVMVTFESGQEEHTYYYYDNNGNVTCKLKETFGNYQNEWEIDASASLSDTGDVTLYTYDVWNQLSAVYQGDLTTDYKYNAEGYRVEKAVNGRITRYLYEYDKVILEVDQEGKETAKNVYGTNLVARRTGGDCYYYMYNGHGDVTALISESGAIAATYYYDAFGNLISETGDVNNNITYAGYQHDSETGLYYLNARYYDSTIARFLTEDTYQGQAKDPLSLNLYTYCVNNPITYYDPSGHVIKKGASGTDVKSLQKLLTEAGYDCGAIDGKFGSKTEAAIVQYQKDNKLKVDGIVGNQTMTSLKQTVEKENSKPTVSTPSSKPAVSTPSNNKPTTSTPNSKPAVNTPSTNNKPVTTTDPVKTPKNTNEVDSKQNPGSDNSLIENSRLTLIQEEFKERNLGSFSRGNSVSGSSGGSSIISAGTGLLGVLILDDATGIGVADDFLIPFVAGGLVVVGIYNLFNPSSSSEEYEYVDGAPVPRPAPTPSPAPGKEPGAGEKGNSETVPDKAKEVANQVKDNNGAPPKGYKGGSEYKNQPQNKGDQRLPDDVKYKEYDVNPYVKGQNRGAERIVIGDDGSAWYTKDHYHSFTQIK